MQQENKINESVGFPQSPQNDKKTTIEYKPVSHKNVLADIVYCNFKRKPEVEMNSWEEVYFYCGVN